MNDIRSRKSRFLTFCFSLMPGAGHMYMGYLSWGLTLMGLFFFSIFIIDFVGLRLFYAFIPMIWFYSFFDAMNIYQGHTVKEDLQVDRYIGKVDIRYFGYFLIFAGSLSIFNQFIYPLSVDYLMKAGYDNVHRAFNYGRVIISSGIFIIIGYKLLMCEDSLYDFINNRRK